MKEMALDDFKKRTKETDIDEQKGLTLVLVTPFTWDSSKTALTLDSWVSDRKKESSWKDVILIDGTKLEHWLDHAPAVAAHWARGVIRNFPIAGVQSTDEYWREFSGRFDPRIIEKLLTTEREDVAEQLLKVLMGPPQQISIVADAPEFATAFAVAAIRSAKEEMREFIEARTLIVDTMEAGRELLGHENMAFLLGSSCFYDDRARGTAATATISSGTMRGDRDMRMASAITRRTTSSSTRPAAGCTNRIKRLPPPGRSTSMVRLSATASNAASAGIA